MARRGVLEAFQGTVGSLERFQVELQGRYSTGRLRKFVEYSQSTTLLRVIAVLVLTAIPCALGIVLVDVMPLQTPSSGLAHQTMTYWVRTFYSCCVVTGTSLIQWHHASASLSLSFFRIGIATFIIATGTTLIMLVLHVLIGFPTPFLYQLIAGPWLMMLATALWTLFKDSVRANTEVKLDMIGFSYLWAAEVTMIIVYPVLNYVFRRLDGQSQTIFSMVLPLWKIALKNWCRVGTDRLEDLAPVLVVFNVDVFHALFLASAMQSSSTTGSSTLFVVMSVDFIQSCVAVMEVYRVYTRARQLETHIKSMERKQTRESTTDSSATTGRPRHRSPAEYADSILSASPHIQKQLSSTNARQRRWTMFIRPLAVRPTKTPRGSVTSSRVCLTTTTHPAPSQHDVPDQNPSKEKTQCLEEIDQAKLEYVQANLKLLHMVEFYMLIEFTEVLIAIVYSIYLLAMAQLPNRQYYLPLQHLTEDQFANTVHRVMKYAALEMLSFVLLAMVFDRMLRISTLRQLLFVLEKHWLLVQSLLVLWVFFPTQMTLEHLGCDYTFKFAWLRKTAKPH